MFEIEVVLSPALLHLAEVKNRNVVVIDILRATSTICTAIHEGAKAVRAIETVDEAIILKDHGYVIAGERNGHKIEGFDMGNSPFECMHGALANKKLALTTTNGTKCITAAMTAGASTVIAGSFLNINATCEWLKSDGRPLVLLCAGWKDKVNLEDALYAGALAKKLLNNQSNPLDCDSTQMVMDLYDKAASNLAIYLEKSSHYQRLSHLHHQEDMQYCLTENLFTTVVGQKNVEMLKIN